ncbi:MAG: UvrD-helicase domain-containing protein [Zetaproteobacteria bacterium]|nr:UvrD-helicase domain-containing protein [Zetaproteobacteria bacterium]
MLDLDTLNAPQREAVVQWTGPMMILAGAGTGKTRVMTTRIARMLQEGVRGAEIVALTFTNKAAREMKERLLQLVPGEEVKKVSVSTFHSFCLRQLRSLPTKVGLKSGFKLLGTSDQLALIMRSLEEKSWQKIYAADQMLAAISSCKNWLISPDGLRSGVVPPQSYEQPPDWAAVAEIMELYERQLDFHQAIDFDDCIYKFVRLLQDNSTELARVHRKFHYFCVDEFQDTNYAQLELLRLMVGQQQHLCVVGDDDQSIYSWRGAMVENVFTLEQMFPAIKMIKLEQNYRCAPNILHASNHVIANNVKRKSKTLWSDKGASKPIRVAEFSTPENEARWVAKHILALSGRGYRFADIAVLYRANNQASCIEMALREARIPSHTVGGQSFFERKEVKDFLAYLRLLVDPGDRLAFWRVINTPNRGLGIASQEKLSRLAEQLKCTPFEAGKREAFLRQLPAATQQNLLDFYAIFECTHLSQASTAAECGYLCSQLLARTGLREQIKREAKTMNARLARLKYLEGLPAWVEKCAEHAFTDNRKGFSPQALFDRLTLGEDETRMVEEEAGNHVTLMTIHASKGLEYEAVVLTGLEEGTLPHRNSLGECVDHSAIDEERRLFYVAMTRAKKELAITCALNRPLAGRKERREKSRFLLEMPEDEKIVEWVSHEEAVMESPEAKKQSMLAKLAFLKDL